TTPASTRALATCGRPMAPPPASSLTRFSSIGAPNWRSRSTIRRARVARPPATPARRGHAHHRAPPVHPPLGDPRPLGREHRLPRVEAVAEDVDRVAVVLGRQLAAPQHGQAGALVPGPGPPAPLLGLRGAVREGRVGVQIEAGHVPTIAQPPAAPVLVPIL